MKTRLPELQKKIGYYFHDDTLLISALMHSSYTNEKHIPKHKCNERLEFLGDAVLELVSSQFLFHSDDKMPEGELTKLRASMVCEPSLAFCAREINLGDFLLGKGEETTGGRFRDSVISDALEALIGAIYLDGGFANAKEFIHKYVLNDLEHKKLFYDSKTILQEIVQSTFKEMPSYHLISEDGPDHNKTFEAQVECNHKKLATGTGKAKKQAEMEAARKALENLK